MSVREQTLGEFIAEIWRGRMFVLVGLIVALLIGAAFLMLSVSHYRAVMILAPQASMSAMAKISTEEGRERSRRVVPGDGLFTRFEASYKGAAVAALLLRDDEIMEGLRRDQSVSFMRGQEEWSAAKLADYIARRVVVASVGETDLREFSYTHSDPAFAKMFLQRLHETADGMIRYGVRRDVNARIEYIEKALEGAVNPDHKRAFAALLMEQERLKMLVSTPQPFAASVVEPSYTQDKVFWPSPLLVLAGFMFAGAFAGFTVYSIRVAFSAPSKQETRQQKKQVRKIREWIRGSAGNSNAKERMRRPFSSEDAAE